MRLLTTALLLQATKAAVTTLLPGTAEPESSDSVKLLKWINETENGFVHPTHSVRRLGPGFRGIFARTPIEKDAVLAVIPWQLCVTHPMDQDGHCGLSRKAVDALVKGETPYAKMLREYDPSLPNDWPPNARQSLDGLPPGDWDRHLKWFEAGCLKRKATEDERRGMYLMVARSGSSRAYEQGGYLFLAPLYDLYNHRNGKYHNTLVKVEEGESISIIAGRDISAGEEIFNTYGEGTLELFRDYGFVEPLPRVWNLASLRFVEDEEGRVTWPAAGPPRGPARDEFLNRLATLKRALSAPLPEAVDEKETALLERASLFIGAVGGAVDAATADLANNRLSGEL